VRAAALVRQRERVEPSGIEETPPVAIKDISDAESAWRGAP